MQPATPNQPDDGEELMQLLVSEAGDANVEPPPEHVAAVRSLLLQRLARPRPAWPQRARLLVGSAMAALSVILALVLFSRSAHAWEDVARALQGRKWIHGSVADADGKLIVEQWFSSNRELGGERAGQEIAFHDYKRKVLTKYVAAGSAVYRLPDPPEGTSGEVNFVRQILDFLLNPKGADKFLFPGSEIINQTRREIEITQKKWIEIELTLRIAGGSRGDPQSMWIRVDPATDLPGSVVIQDEEGKKYTASFDYPESGPADIYDLGVPRTAKVIDRFLPAEVQKVLAALKAERREFDDYCEYVVENQLLPTNYFPRTTVYRVWRKGLKWRIDRLRPASRDWSPPADTDTKWWKEHQSDFEFVPTLICNGNEYWDYYLADSWKAGMPVPQPGQQTAFGQVVGPNALSGKADDPVLPFWTQNLLVEQAGHPTAGVYEPDHDREFLVETKPTSGPSGTVLLRGRDPTPAGVGIPDHFRLWLDPKANYLSMRTEIRVHEAGAKRGEAPKFAWLDTHVVEGVAKSPKGHSYPTQTRHTAHKGAHEIVRKHFVDFEAQVPAELFEPLK